MGVEAANASANAPSGSRREGGATSPSPKASRALRVQFFALVAAIACAFLGHAAAVGVIAERKLALQRFEARLSAVMDSWHQLLMTTHRLPYRQERPKESWSGGVVTGTVKRHVRSGSAELCVEDTASVDRALVCLHAGVTDRRLWPDEFNRAVQAFLDRQR